MTDDICSERYKADDGTIQTRYLADLIGLKRGPVKNGRITWIGVSTNEPKEIEIEFKIIMDKL